MAQFPTAMNGGPNMWAITSEERTKHDKQFDNLKPSGGYITGDQARTFFLQSGLPAPVLAEIWALSDLNKDGKMDQQEFSIAMKLIKLKAAGPTAAGSSPSYHEATPNVLTPNLCSLWDGKHAQSVHSSAIASSGTYNSTLVFCYFRDQYSSPNDACSPSAFC